MKYVVVMDVEINNQDADVIDLLPGAIKNRFDGTPIKISNIRITEDDRNDQAVDHV
jgi:disulfide oxidoreductase YuzD